MRPSDLPRFCDHLLRLDRESRRDRFNGPADDEFVVAYAERSFAEGTTVVGYVEDDQVFGAAELHERPEEPEPTAEIAFSVERAFQNRGIGGRLFERLILHALGLGYSKLCVTTHPQNAAMKALARRFNAKLSFEEGETVGVIQLHPVLDAISGWDDHAAPRFTRGKRRGCWPIATGQHFATAGNIRMSRAVPLI